MRGNPAMKAKRVTGPTPNTVLCSRVAQERCYVKGCSDPVVLVRDVELHTVKRCCAKHVDGLTTKQRTARSGGGSWKPPWLSH
jgi:hypothetical protein